MKNIKAYEDYSGINIHDILQFYYYKKDKSKLTVVNSNNRNVSDLSGIEELTNLEEFICNFAMLSNLDGIENCIKLKKLKCYNNLITSLDPIYNLTNLEYLSCDNNKITSLKGIENLTKLKDLTCIGNIINWVDYIDKDGRTYYIKLPKSIKWLESHRFFSIEQYYEFMDKNQPSGISRKFNF